MAVEVTTADVKSGGRATVTHDDGDTININNGHLIVGTNKSGGPVAIYAPGHWVAATQKRN
jgi:hypothetical protein